MPDWSLAIDFGTSNTAAAYQMDGAAVLPVRLTDQAEQMPSAILALDSGIVVGTAAIRSARLDPQRFEPNPKRRIGEGEIFLGPREWAVVDLVAAVLAQVRQRCERMAGGVPPRRVILTYPEQWAGTRREVLRQAGFRAGLGAQQLEMISEPIAAASWYASIAPVPPGQSVAVFDFGGGTCDVAVLEAGANNDFRVLASSGVDPLGGEQLDERLLAWTLDQLTRNGYSALAEAFRDESNLAALLTLREQVRQAKHELADYESTRIPVALGGQQTVLTVTVAEFETVIGPDIDAAIALTNTVLRDAGITRQQLYAMYLTGGSSHLRLVHRRITELLGRPPSTLNDPKLVVSQGALLGMSVQRDIGPHAPGPAPGSGALTVQISGPLAGRIDPVLPPVAGPGPTHPFVPAFGSMPPPRFDAPPPRFDAPPPRFDAPPPRFDPPPPGLDVPTDRSPGGSWSPPPVGPYPPGGQRFEQLAEPGAPAPRRSKALMITMVVAVVAVIGLAGWLILRPSSGPDDLGGSTAAGVLPTGSTGAPVSSSDSTTTTTTSTSTTSTSTTSTSTPTSTTTTTTPTTTTTTTTTTSAETRDCWDGSTVAVAGSCPALEGQQALEWVFPPDDLARNCTTYDDPDTAAGEIEEYQCTLTDHPNVTMWLSRWDSTASSLSAHDAWDITDWTLTSDTGDVDAGKRFDHTNDDDGTVFRFYAYKDYPYSVEIIGEVPDDGSDVVAEVEAVTGLFISEYPDTLATFGS